MTPILCCGYECGITTGHFTASNGVLNTTTVNNGLRSYRVNLSASSNSSQLTLTSYSRLVGRVYIHFTTLPTAAKTLFGTDTVAPAAAAGPSIYFNNADNKLYAQTGATLGATGIAVTTGQWYRLDFDFNIQVAGNDTCDLQVNGVAAGQATAAGTSSNSTSLNIGPFSSATVDMYYDDWLLSNTAADYPLGAGKVLSFVPNADGTHTATGSDIVKGTIAAPTGGGSITSSTTDAFNRVNGRPLLGGASDNTMLINQQTAASTEYVEVGFEDTVEVNPPRAVEVLTADRQAGTQAGVFQTKLNDNGTEDAIVNRGSAAGQTTDRFVTKQYATMVGGGAWTLARFNGLKARFGYSSDATPDQYWRGIMIEAEFPESLDASAFGIPEGPSGQRQMQQLLSQ